MAEPSPCGEGPVGEEAAAAEAAAAVAARLCDEAPFTAAARRGGV